jgi:hypothetical protein
VYKTRKRSHSTIYQKNPLIWHERLSHIGQKALIKLLKAVTRYKFNKTSERTDKCEICIKAKIITDISRELFIQAIIYLELIYSDICSLIAS